MNIPVVLVAAVAQNGVIGSMGGMPWRLSSDLKRFKSITMGKPVIMGRKTFQSIGKPLPGRFNVVLSRTAIDGVGDKEAGDDKAWGSAAGISQANTLPQALEMARQWAFENDASEICVIGGGEIYRQSLELADRIYLTRVLAEPQGETTFPDLAKAEWEVVSSQTFPKTANDSAETIFVEYQRK